MQQFARLIDGHEAETLEFVAKAKWLEPEELFYLGFHFAEKERAEKKFGGEMLRLVARPESVTVGGRLQTLDRRRLSPDRRAIRRKTPLVLDSQPERVGRGQVRRRLIADAEDL